MKKELDYFTIEGCYGGNQDWFTNLVMHMGGCAAATACDSCIYFGLQNEKMKPLYPFDIECLTKEDYKAFSQIMKPYLKPRAGGVRKLSWFVEGLGRYIQDVNEAKHTDIYIRMEEFCGDHTWQEAAIFIKEHSCTVPAFAPSERSLQRLYLALVPAHRIRRKRWKNVHQNSNLWGKRHLRT